MAENLIGRVCVDGAVQRLVPWPRLFPARHGAPALNYGLGGLGGQLFPELAAERIGDVDIPRPGDADAEAVVDNALDTVHAELI